MNDDELKELFDNVIDPESVDDKKSSESDVSVPLNSEKTEDKKPEEEKAEITESDEKPDDNSKEEANSEEGFSERLDKIKRRIKAWYIKIRSEKKVEKKTSSGKSFFEEFPLSFGAVMAILITLIVIVFFMCFLFLPQFRVLNFEINGNITISNEELISQSGIELNSHLFSNVSGDIIDFLKLDYGKIEDKMKANNPYIKDIQINVDFPSTIRMDVVERNKIAYIEMPDGYAAIDDEGTVIELVTIVPDQESHAVICGLDVSGAVLLEKIDIKNDSDFQKAIIVLGAIITADVNGSTIDDYALFSNTKEIRIIPGGNIYLTIILPSGSQLQVKLNDIANINDDMAILRRAIIMDTFEGLPNGSFDMTGEEYIYRKYD